MIQLDKTKQHDILLIGEILVDLIRSNRGSLKRFGGSPANITRNLKRMGLDPILCARYGTDEYGDLIRQTIQKENLNQLYLDQLDTATSVVHINQSVDTPVPEFARDADYQIELTDQLKLDIAKSKLIHFSFWTLTEEPLKSTMLDIIKLAEENNVIIGFDPNYHKDIHPGYDKSELMEIMKHVNIIKPSLDDSRRIFEDDLQPLDYLQRYSDMGISLIVMTLGKDGIIVRYNNDIVAMPSLATDVVDATGAGDAFWSGLYAALIHGEPLHDCLNLGQLCSAYNLTHVGSETDLPHYNILIKELRKENLE